MAGQPLSMCCLSLDRHVSDWEGIALHAVWKSVLRGLVHLWFQPRLNLTKNDSPGFTTGVHHARCGFSLQHARASESPRHLTKRWETTTRLLRAGVRRSPSPSTGRNAPSCACVEAAGTGRVGASGAISRCCKILFSGARQVPTCSATRSRGKVRSQDVVAEVRGGSFAVLLLVWW